MSAYTWKTATQNTRTAHQHSKQVCAEWSWDIKGTIGQTNKPSLLDMADNSERLERKHYSNSILNVLL